MPKTYSIAEARDALTRLLHWAKACGVKAVAVLLSQREYARLTAAPAGFWNAYTSFRKSLDLNSLGIEPAIFAGARDKSPGREIEW